MLTQARASPDIANYLAYILSNQPLVKSLGLSNDNLNLVRSSAAITLKNYVRASYSSITETDRSFVRSSVLQCLEDTNTQVRNLAGSVITEVVQRGGILGWPQLLPELISLASNEQGSIPDSAQDGAMGALWKVCEDHKNELNKDYQGQRPLEYIIPKLLNITSSPIATVRARALQTLNSFIPQGSHAIEASMNLLFARLFQLGNDPSADVRRYVCRAFTQLAETQPNSVRPHMKDLVDYMIIQQKDTTDPELALEASEFWLGIGENEYLKMDLGPSLDKIVPVLLQSMIYDEEEIIRVEGDAEDADNEDKEQDLKPMFARAKPGRSTANGQGSGVNGNGTLMGSAP